MPEADNHQTPAVDVLVVGAGPVGLVTALQLAKFGCRRVRIVEKHAKSAQDEYGRAITLFPRTSEMLDQLGLADDLLQHCFACRDTVAYDARGREVHGRGWSFMEEMRDTAFDFALVLRQKYQEAVFREAMGRLGVFVEARVEIVGAVVDGGVKGDGDGDRSDGDDDYRITATLLDHKTNRQETVRCKYLIGCDGGRSTVRRLFDIPFEGSSTEDKWVRIDGKIKTDLPKPRTYCSIESPTHGNVLWAALDHGATRIGYAFADGRYSSDDTPFDQDAAVREAIAAAKPFKLEFERVDWWTVYKVGQRIAARFRAGRGRVFLAGDACHTHSSGAAQGMNTGIHDAVNLAWKLSLVLRGLADHGLLDTYQAERLPNVRRLIRYDQDISCLMTGRLPEDYVTAADGENVDVHEVLGKVMAEAGTFSSGLGISYGIEEGNPLVFGGSFVGVGDGGEGIVKSGMRAPDVSLFRPGTLEKTRLIRETPNLAMFRIMLFAPEDTSPVEQAFCLEVAKSGRLQGLVQKDCLSFLTILPTQVPSAYEVLGHEPLGRVYFDSVDKAAFRRYGVAPGSGAVVVLRPDGWIGTVVALQGGAVGELEAYFGRIFL